ncbi:MAG: hypothetical protein FWD47_06835 [Treponema sp.]|nr:hypothetical protein [Treponema sp.]
MPWRLIIIIIIFSIFLAFIALNLDDNYKSDINFGFEKAENVPVFFTIFISFAIGFFCALPLIFYVRKKRNDIPQKINKTSNYDLPNVQTPGHERVTVDSDDQIKKDAASAKKRFLSRNNGGKS